MKYVAVLVVVISGLLLGACTPRNTHFGEPVPADISANWRLAGVKVIVPETLTVSERDTYAPEADIVWHGDPLLPGTTRQQQIAAIVKSGITDAAKRLHGSRPVILQATVTQFHAITPVARESIGGMHNVDFTLNVLDARTGALIIGPVTIEADEVALSGAEAYAAADRGETQKVRIRNRIFRVVATWLGVAGEGEQVVQGSAYGVGR